MYLSWSLTCYLKCKPLNSAIAISTLLYILASLLVLLAVGSVKDLFFYTNADANFLKASILSSTLTADSNCVLEDL